MPDVLVQDRLVASVGHDRDMAAAKQHGFVATDHRVEITGLCADCR